MIDSRAKLKSRLAYISNRDDLFDAVEFPPAVIDGELDTAIDNATLTISRDLARRGGTGLQEAIDTSITTTNGVETVTFPSDLAGIKHFAITANPERVMIGTTMDGLIAEFPTPVTGTPVKYAQVAVTTAFLRPIPDSTYTTRLIYFQKLAMLTDTTTNPIFDAYPDIYEAAAMVEISLFVEDEQATTRWRVVYDQKMNDMTAQDRSSAWAAALSGSGPTVQITVA